jgi:hypothetical protein
MPFDAVADCNSFVKGFGPTASHVFLLEETDAEVGELLTKLNHRLPGAGGGAGR